MEFKEKNFLKKDKTKDNQIEDMKIVTKNMSLRKISESEIFFVPLLQHKGERAFEIVRVGQEVMEIFRQISIHLFQEKLLEL